jgi:DNA end-binding protein Ku
VPSSEELELGAGLIEKLSSENFEPEAYRDEYRNRMLALIDEKAKGREITVPPKVAAPDRVIDLRAALRESMKTVERGKKKADQKTRRKA